MKLAHAEADVAAAIGTTKKRRTKRNAHRQPTKSKIGSKIHKMAHALLAYVRSGFQAVYDKGYEFGAKLRRYSRAKVGKLLAAVGTNTEEFCDNAKKAGWYAMQAGKYLLIVSTLGVVVTTVYGGVLTIITTPVVMLAGLTLAASKFVGGGNFMGFVRSWMVRIAGRRAAPALRVV